MQGGLDYIMLQYLNIDGIRTIGSVLGQSIALDYYVRQVCIHHKFLHFCFCKGIFIEHALFTFFCFRLMELLQNLLTLIVGWRKLEPLQWKEKSYFN